MGRFATLLRWSALAVGTLIAALFGLMLLGAHVYALPLLSPYGSLILSWFSPWFVVFPLIAAALIWWGGPRARRRLRTWLSFLAVAVAAVGLIAVGRMVAVADDNGVRIDLALALASHAPLAVAADHDAVYSSFAGKPLRLAIYRPAGARTPAPILLYVHGGGWVEGDRRAGAENMRWFARQGWLAVAIDYPLSSRDRHLWDSTTGQVGCAMTWLRSNARRFGGDPARLALMGDSAGGNLALNAAYRANAGTLRSPCGDDVGRVTAVAVVYPAVDLAGVYASKVPQFGDLARLYADAYVGGSPARFPERYAAIDPAAHLGPKGPPTLILVGENDHLLPPRLTYAFAQQARNSGVAVQLVRFPYGQHLFDQATNSVGSQLVRGATLRFIERQQRR